MTSPHPFHGRRVMVVALEGWNDAGEAASAVLALLGEHSDARVIFEVDPEEYFDYQFTRPTSTIGDDGKRIIDWPGASIARPAEIADVGPYLLRGAEPARRWMRFSAELMAEAQQERIEAIVFLGAMLADVPHTREISIFTTSENDSVREQCGIARSSYEGPIGILSVLAQAAEVLDISTVSLWASVPHYVHSSPSPQSDSCPGTGPRGCAGVHPSARNARNRSEGVGRKRYRTGNGR